MVTSLNSHTFFLVEKWIPPNRSETKEIGQKNRRNFRRLDLTFYSIVEYSSCTCLCDTNYLHYSQDYLASLYHVYSFRV